LVKFKSANLPAPSATGGRNRERAEARREQPLVIVGTPAGI
jgi:hypothetical protein